MRVTEQGIEGDREFPSTSWSVIVHARDPGAPDYARHIERLVALYWKPVYCVVRFAWKRSHEDAKDLAQEFFATVVFDRDLLTTFAPERGSFRALLRTALTRFLRDELRAAGRQKRGAGAAPLALQAVGSEVVDSIPDAAALTPEQIFDVAWNEAVLSEALSLLEARLTAEGKSEVFAVFRRYDVEGEGAQLSYAALGEQLSLSVPRVKHALREARERFREIVTALVRGYVDETADLAAELRSLFGT